MTVINPDPLTRLQDWYRYQADGRWEHHYGISITTLDNPGWCLSIDLDSTTLSNRPFKNIKYRGSVTADWFDCYVRDNKYQACSGPMMLGEIISIFFCVGSVGR